VLAILMSLVVSNPTLANPDCRQDVLRLADAIMTIQSEYERDGGKLSMVEAEDFVRKALPARVAPECLKPIDKAFAGQSLPLIDGALPSAWMWRSSAMDFEFPPTVKSAEYTLRPSEACYTSIA